MSDKSNKDWFFGTVEELDYTSGDENSQFRHNIRFSSLSAIPKSDNTKSLPIAVRIGEPSVEVQKGDPVIILSASSKEGTAYFYFPIVVNGKVEMYSGVKNTIQDPETRLPISYDKTNVIDLTSGNNKDLTKNTIQIKSDNSVTIESGSASIKLDAETGAITIFALKPASGVTIVGNLNVNGKITALDEVSAFGDLYQLSKHFHASALVYPTPPPVPGGISLFS